MWHQRFRTNWLRDGDKNTKFFHAHANARRKRNFITGITNKDGFWETKQENINQNFQPYFIELFSPKSSVI